MTSWPALLLTVFDDSASNGNGPLRTRAPGHKTPNPLPMAGQLGGAASLRCSQ